MRAEGALLLQEQDEKPLEPVSVTSARFLQLAIYAAATFMSVRVTPTSRVLCR